MIPSSSPRSPPLAVPGRKADSDVVLLHDLAVLAAHDDGGFLDADALLRLKLLEKGQGVVGVAVVFERDGDHAVAAGAAVTSVLGVC